jgi:alpha-tubulin suppressor-like RCC1 family protein
VPEPTLIGPLLGKRISKISCGFEHSCALAKSTNAGGVMRMRGAGGGGVGEQEEEDERSVVYAWGSGEDGRLGNGDTERRWVPTLVESLAKLDVVDVIASETHTLALTQCMEVEEMHDARKEAQSKKATKRRETVAMAPAKDRRDDGTDLINGYIPTDSQPPASPTTNAIGKHGGPRIQFEQ